MIQISSVLGFISVVQAAACFIVVLYLWSVRHNSAATWWLFIYFLGILLGNTFLFLSNAVPFWGIIFDPTQEIFLVMGIMGMAQFAYHYPRVDQPREAALIRLFSLLLISTQTIYCLFFCYSVLILNTIPTVPDWYSAIMLISTLTTIGIFGRRYLFYISLNLTPPYTISRWLKELFKPTIYQIGILRDFIFIGILAILVSSSAIFGLDEDFAVMISALATINGTILIYIHYSAEQTSFIVKLVGTSLLIISIVTGAVGIDSINNTIKNSKYWQAQHLEQLLISHNLKAMPPEVLTIFHWYINQPIPQTLYSVNPTITLPPQLTLPQTTYTWYNYRDFQTRRIYDILVIKTPTSVYEIYMLNPEFKLKLHEVSIVLIIQFTIAALLVILGLPLFLQYNIIRPLNKLLAGVQQANEGNLDIYIPIQYYDEIGILTESFNTSMASIRQAEAEHTRLNTIEQELTLAHQMQNSLLPAPRPNWPHLDILCFNTPARQVGGDFYQYYAAPRNSLTTYALAIGDVSGKGMPAALLMAVSLASLGIMIQHNLSPAELLAKLDLALLPYTQKNRQNCAMCYAEIQQVVQHYHLRLANAGCIAPIIKRANGLVEWVEVGGTPLGTGLSRLMPYQQLELWLELGDMLILTTDGIVEAQNDQHELYGFARLEAAVQASPMQSAETMLEYLKHDLLSFVGQTEQYDDMTIIVVKI